MSVVMEVAAVGVVAVGVVFVAVVVVVVRFEVCSVVDNDLE